MPFNTAVLWSASFACIVVTPTLCCGQHMRLIVHAQTLDFRLLVFDDKDHLSLKVSIEPWTEVGRRSLLELLEKRSLRCVEEKVQELRLTPPEARKLKAAALVQANRDCRTIDQFGRMRGENTAPNKWMDETRAEIRRLILEGVNRDDSLFVKVLNNMR